MGRLRDIKDRQRRTRRYVLIAIAISMVVALLAYERDEVVQDATKLLHHRSLGSMPRHLEEISVAAPVRLGTPPPERDPTVFVGIIAYREPECHATLAHMFAQAVIPTRIFAGVCQQNFLPRGSSEDCRIGLLPEKLQQNVRVVQMNSTEARGVAPARAIASGQYAGEDYWLQIDGHSRFDYGWDQRLIDELEVLKECSPNPVISTYPPGLESLGVSHEEKKNFQAPRICNGTFKGGPEGGMFRFEGGNYKPNGFAVRVPFAAGGFMFGPGKVLRDIAFDPNLPFLFDGEEVMFAVRLFTHGYDVFSPSMQVIYHHYVAYGERKVNVFADRNAELWRQPQKDSTKRVAYLLGITDQLPPEGYRQELEKYGPGKVRDMQQWAEWSGVNFKDPSKVTAGHKFCREDIPMDKSRLCPITQEARNKFNAAKTAAQ